MLKLIARTLIPLRWHWSRSCPRYLTNLVLNRTKMQVYDGPFKDLKYIDHSLASVYIPKLLGIYENELHSYIEKACDIDFDSVIDIGAAEGYYAVGMALRLKKAIVTAFEIEEEGQKAIAELAGLNGLLGSMNILGRCELMDLKTSLRESGRTLIICDVEGYEETLLDIEKIPALKDAYILVELHDFVKRDLSQIIRERFQSSHRIEHIWQTERSLNDFPFKTIRTRIIPKAYIENELSEFRPERMSWFWMEPMQEQSSRV